ncbi:hypothetical protein EW026_g5698 [Hermanssonia centrifuga]|uniref:Gag protein n=1 Tax=Hermanssonia centrifuga TaxID=98765 RepID=A0A4S4KD89_9APHY|nr:hypothetical protein EW026_g5698 [Hermanssonia centrifuga]
MTALVPLTKFGGDDPTEDAHTFMLELEANFDDNLSDKRKMSILAALIKRNSSADTWFESVPDATKAKWDDLKTAFKLQWPKKPAQGISVTEAVDTLKSRVLTSSRLGSYETMHNQDVPAHVVWGRSIVADAKKWNVPGLIANDIRAAMPDPLKGLLSTVITEWDVLLKELESVSVPALKERVKERNKYEQRRLDLERNLSKVHLAGQRPMAYPTASYQHRQSTAPRPPLSSGDAFSRGPLPRRTPPDYGGAATYNSLPRGPPQQSFQRAPFRSLASPHVRLQRLRDNTARIPHQPDTPEGRAAYQRQCDEWARVNNTLEPREDNPYPLTPGTLPLGSRECYRCAQGKHPASSCTADGVPPREASWRAAAGNIIRTATRMDRAGPANVLYIGNHYRPYQPSYDDNVHPDDFSAYEYTPYQHGYLPYEVQAGKE